MLDSLKRRFKNWLWLHNTRCVEDKRTHPFMTCATAQAYLHYIEVWFDPCRVCGSKKCRHATERKTARRMSDEYMEKYERMMNYLMNRRR